MSWTPISNTVPQYEDAGIPASGFYLKFYLSGTVTPTPMATDSTGGTTLDKAQLNTEGYPINGSSAVFIPHIDRKYKLILYRNATDADNNTTVNAVWVIDELDPVVTAQLSQIKSFDTTSSASSDANIVSGQTISVKEYSTGSSGGGFWDAVLLSSVTPNDIDIIASTGGQSPAIALEFSPGTTIDAAQLGAKEGTTTNNNEIIRRALSLAKEKGSREVILNRQSVSGSYGLEKISGTSAIKLVSGIDFTGVGSPELLPIVDTTTFMEASIFIPGNYHPDFWQSVAKESVTLVDGDGTFAVVDVNDYPVGSLVMVTSQSNFLSAGFPVFTYMTAFEVISHTGSSIDLSGSVGFSGTGFVSNADNATLGRFGISLFMLRDCKISGFKVKTLGHMIADSATYNVTFSNISGLSRSGVFGNTYTNSFFDDINMTCSHAFSELSFGSVGNLLTRIKLTDDATGLSSGQGFSWQESGLNNVMDGFELTFNGTSTTGTPLRIQDHSNSIIKNGTVNIRTNSNNVLTLTASGTANVKQQTDSGFEGVTITSPGGVPVVCDAFQTSTTGKLERGFFDDIRYIGPTPSTAAIRVQGNASNEIEELRFSMFGDASDLPISVSNAKNLLLSLSGDWIESSLITLASSNSIELINGKRTSVRSIVFHSDVQSLVSTDVANTVLKEFIIPLASLLLSDRFSVSASFNTAGLAGNKTIQIGIVDSVGAFQSIDIVDAGQIFGKIKTDINMPLSNSAQIYGETWAGGASYAASRIGLAILDSATNDIKIQVRAWVATAGDTINFSDITMDFSEVLKG